MKPVYRGKAGRAIRYRGKRTDTAIYLGLGVLFATVAPNLWTPDELGSKVQVWWDAQTAASIATAGAKVTSWASRVGTIVAGQSDAGKQMSYSANALNGYPAIVSGQGLQMSTGSNSLALDAASGPITVVGVVKPNGSNGEERWADGDGANRPMMKLGSDFAVALADGAYSTDVGTPNAVGDIHLQTVVSGGAGIASLNGTTTALANSPLTQLTQIYLSGDAGTYGSFQGWYGEVLYIQGALSTDERQRLEGYLAWRWGLQAYLPVEHPYKLAAPTVTDLWTPANLTYPPRVIVDAREAVWSGTDLVSINNTGSNGGTFEAYLGTVTKGDPVNGVAPLVFDEAVLVLADQTFGSDKRVFLHVGAYESVHGALWGLDWTALDGTFVHYPRDADNGDQTIVLASGASFLGASGTDIRTESLNDSDWHGFTEILGTTAGAQSAEVDGVSRALTTEDVGTVPAEGPLALYMGGSGPTWGPEYLKAKSLWAAICDDITPSDKLKWQGWRAWSVLNMPESLPDSHPYRYAPPTTASDEGGSSGGSDLTAWRAGIAAVSSGTRNAVGLIVGDSTSAGFGALSTSVSNNDRSMSAPTQLAALLATATGVKVSWQNLMGNANADYDASTAAYDHRLTLGTGWTNSAVHGVDGTTLGGYFLKGTDASGRLSFHPTTNCDTFDVYYVVNAGESLIAQVNLGADKATLDTSGVYAKATISETLGDNTLNLRTSGSEGFVGAIIAYDSAVKEIQLLNAGWDGMKSPDLIYAGQDWNIPNCIDNFGPDLVIINNGINDAIAGTSESDYKSNMQVAIDKALATAASVVLAQPNRISGYDAGEANIRAWISDLADSNSLPMIDLGTALGSYAEASAAGLMRDAVHPNADGYAIIAQAYADFLLA